MQNVSLYDVSYNTLFGSKPLRISFDEADGFIRTMMGLDIYYCLPPKYDAIYNTVRYFISQKK